MTHTLPSQLAGAASRCRDGVLDFNARYRLPEADCTARGGAIPLMQRGGTLIGSAALSGLPDTEDHRIVADSIREFLG